MIEIQKKILIKPLSLPHHNRKHLELKNIGGRKTAMKSWIQP
jgi:hypothetical protein